RTGKNRCLERSFASFPLSSHLRLDHRHEPIRQNRSVDKYHRCPGPADIILDVRPVQLYSFHSWRSSHFPRACAMRRVSAVCCRRRTLPSRIVQKWANRDCTLRPFFETPKYCPRTVTWSPDSKYSFPFP